MSVYLDSSVLIAALVDAEPQHEVCLDQLAAGEALIWSHGLTECFATLTGGRLGLRVDPATATQLLQATVAPRVRTIELSAQHLLQALAEAQQVGARGVPSTIFCTWSRPAVPAPPRYGR